MTTRSISGLAYPDRFYAAAAYAGFGALENSSKAAISRFKNEIALMLYGLYQQATVGSCNIPKPRSWNPIENSKWTSWNELGDMASTEAMRLFVKILEEEDPAWYSKVVPEPKSEPVVEVQNPSQELASHLDNSVSVPKETATENGNFIETQDKDVVLEGLGSIGVYDQWVAPSVFGRRPKARYEHAAAVVQDKMYVFGGNHNGRYLNDIQALDLKSLTWSKIEAKMAADPSQTMLSPCAGHSLIRWGNKLLAIAGHAKDPSDTVTVHCFDTETCTWSVLKSYGKAPIARGGQSVTLVGSSLVMFGGEDSKRSLMNDLNILDLETMTWDAIEPIGTPPSPRSDHTAAVHADKYLLIFGGGSHSTCFSDLHVLDLQTMEWSQPKMQGTLPTPRAGHAGVTLGENWYIVGGGDNKSGVSETMVLNMSILVWSVVTTVQGRVPIASEGLSLVVTSHNGEDILVAFGGYNGKYSNELYVLKPSHKGILEPKILESSATTSVDPVLPVSNGIRDIEAEEVGRDGKVREIVMDNPESEPLHQRSVETKEQIIASMKADKDNLEARLSTEHSLNSRLKQELSEAQAANAELTEELRSVRGQLAVEQGRCFRLEVDVAELRQKLQSMESLQQEVELLQRQKAASEQAAANAQQKQSSIWGWLAGSPPEPKSVDA
uniref:ACB domain-containing protein n=1 Tax=Araucaria cunninghamii TaxID=56994 RepID=A0A0D6R7M9_ARACU